MKRLVISLGLLLLLAAPAFSATIFIDYDRTADFESYKTFAWGPTPETSLQGDSPLMHSRIKNAIEHYLTQGEKGLVETSSDPDLYVTYHTSDKERLSVNTSSSGYGYGPGWGWDPYWGGGMGTSTSTVTTYTEGTLVIDIWDAATKRAIWRGSITDTVPTNPEKVSKKIDKALAKLVKKWDKMYAGR